MIIGMNGPMAEGDMTQVIEEQKSYGLRLAESSVPLYEDRDDSRFNINMRDLMEGDQAGPYIEDPWVRAGTAITLENTRKYFSNMSEATRLINVGDFQKYAFNMVRVLFPSLAAHEWASVQALQGPVGLVFFMKFIYNLTKGTAKAGQDIIENPNESYSSEVIDSEQLGTGTGSVAQFTGNLTYTPVKPGTLTITGVSSSATLTVTDDGNGNLVGDVNGGGNNTINYTTGAYDVTFSGNIDSGEPVNATYTYDSESNNQLAEIDLTLTSSPVTAITRKLRTKWSIEAQQDLKNLHGLDAEVEQVAGITSELKFEIDRDVIRDMRNIASNTVTAFSQTPATGISFTEHRLLFIQKLIAASHEILGSTQRAVGTWVNAGLNVASLMKGMPGFKGMPKPPNTRGVYKSGRLNDEWDVWTDPSFPGTNLTDAPDPNSFLMGYKGQMMWEVGYILAPYIMAYTTPTTMLDDFQGRKGIASRYGKKAIDGRFFCKGSISGSPF